MLRSAMIRTSAPKIHIPENANLLPWSYVFLILFASISVCSVLISIIESLQSSPGGDKDILPTAQAISLSEDITEPPLRPETRKRWYEIGDPIPIPTEYLYSSSKSTR